jgi:hypothetical protein
VGQGDIARPSLGELDWSEKHRTESLSKVYAHADGYARQAEEWYARQRRVKRISGTLMRAAAICLGAAAAILPILAQIFTEDGKPAIEPGWASVALGLAAALVVVDLTFGFSSGWMRFIATELRVTQLRHDFEYSWELARLEGETVPQLVARARAFIRAVDAELVAETGAWATELRANLAAFEERLRAAGRG